MPPAMAAEGEVQAHFFPWMKIRARFHPQVHARIRRHAAELLGQFAQLNCGGGGH
jgi:hypothetical protein